MELLVNAVAEHMFSGIIKRLRTVRIEADISQDALAVVLPVRGRAISEWEREEEAPTYNNLLLWTDALGQRLVMVDRGSVLPSVQQRAGELWVDYERRRLAVPLRLRRQARGMSHARLGEVIGVSGDSVWRWELGRNPPRPIAKAVWTHSLGCSLELETVGLPDPRVKRGGVPRVASSRAAGRPVEPDPALGGERKVPGRFSTAVRRARAGIDRPVLQSFNGELLEGLPETLG